MSAGSVIDETTRYSVDQEWVETTISRRTELLTSLKRAYLQHKTLVSQDDEMWASLNEEHRLPHYMYGGRCAMKLITNALISADIGIPQTVLDFPCGHGRVLRFLDAAYPQAELWAGDVNEGGVRFCADHFRAQPIISQADLRKVIFPKKFDLIWCGSLATHLSVDKVIDLLDVLTDALNPNGILGITTCARGAMWAQNNVWEFIHPVRFETAKRQYDLAGFGYAEYSDGANYGMTYIDPSWMLRYIYGKQDFLLLSLVEKGWHGVQDAYFIMRRPLSHWYELTD